MIEQASAGYGSGESAVEILSKIKLNLVPGSRIGLLGKNGAGKSTLIKLLAGELTTLSGTVQLAKGVQLGYFAQHQLDTLRADGICSVAYAKTRTRTNGATGSRLFGQFCFPRR